MRQIIQVENLSKQYRIGERRPKHGTLRDSVAGLMRPPFGRLKRAGGGEKVWALRDVSFGIKPGEIVGIVGHNGAGKSTLLKILSRITEPTSGRVKLYGRVSSLLEVGTGFHPELTGRENVYLNGSILGMKRDEINRKFDEIVSFAEIEKFIDTPVKHYSSGMYVRLAFAVAAHLEPEVLIVDEVLAVGDVAFQKKCLGKMGDVAKEGRTVLFVSHNMGATRALCERVVLIGKGIIMHDGAAEEVVSKYLSMVAEQSAQHGAGAGAGEQVAIERVVFRDSRGGMTLNFNPGDDMTIEVHFRARQSVVKPYFWIGVVGQHGPLFGANMLIDGCRPDRIEGTGVIACVFKAMPLLPQGYTVRMGVRGEDGGVVLAETKEVGYFNVVGRMKDIGFTGELADTIAWDSSPVIVPYQWRFPDGNVKDVSINRSKASE